MTQFSLESLFEAQLTKPVLIYESLYIELDNNRENFFAFEQNNNDWFNPFCGYKACLAPGKAARHPFFKI